MARSVFGGRIAVSRITLVLAVGDMLLITLFVAMGEIQHGGTVAAGIRTFSQFFGAWIVVATLTGAYAPDALETPRYAARIALVSWVLAALLGQLIRSDMRNAGIAPAFLVVSLVVGVVLLVPWRVAVANYTGSERSVST